ncbi:MAG TPA: polysaccharide biosynthesis C-terminal domain-containing protein [Bacteroidota bacterium]|nr:polysaccharide biosynthesis C-terminal domain-containing protein [Bacteroidota bacterium]
MRAHLQRLGTDTAIYGISTIVGRFLNFLLVPFYTNILVPAELGIVSYIYSIIAFVNVLYAYGMESAYFKYSSSLEIGTQKQNFSAPFISLLSTSALFSLLIVLLRQPLGAGLNIPAAYSSIVLYAAGIMALDALAIVPFAILRVERKAKLFATIKIVNIVINVGLNVLLLVKVKMGITGIFLSGLAASTVTMLLLLPTILRNISWDFNVPLLKAMLRFALPYIPAGLATQAIQVIDRPIMRALTNDATVGIYQANYRLGIFMMLIVQMFDFAWRPFYFATSSDPNARKIFSRVLTYVVFVMGAIFLVLTLFIRDIVRFQMFGHHLIHPDYWIGLGIVPIVLLGYLFLGVSNTLSAGVYIEKKTQYLPVITFIGAGVNIGANYLLIPSMGIAGGAWATLLAYAVMAAVLYVVAQRIYPIEYEMDRLGKIVATAVIVVILFLLIPFNAMSELAGLGVKLLLLGLFMFLIWIMNFFRKEEMSFMKEFLAGLKSQRFQSDVKEAEDYGA